MFCDYQCFRIRDMCYRCSFTLQCKVCYFLLRVSPWPIHFSRDSTKTSWFRFQSMPSLSCRSLRRKGMRYRGLFIVALDGGLYTAQSACNICWQNSKSVMLECACSAFWSNRFSTLYYKASSILRRVTSQGHFAACVLPVLSTHVGTLLVWVYRKFQFVNSRSK